MDDVALAGMNRMYFRTSYRTLEEVGEWIDQVAEGGQLGLLGGHSYYDTLPAERVRDTLRMTRERGIEIKTLRGALSDLGVATPAPTATPTPTPTPDPTTRSKTPPAPETLTPRDGGALAALLRRFQQSCSAGSGSGRRWVRLGWEKRASNDGREGSRLASIDSDER